MNGERISTFKHSLSLRRFIRPKPAGWLGKKRQQAAALHASSSPITNHLFLKPAWNPIWNFHPSGMGSVVLSQFLN
jgi:hypothetical protein